MSSLVVGGVAIKVAVSSPRWTRSDAVDRARAFDNTFRASQTGGAVRVWDFETPPVLASTEGETYKAALSTVASQLCSGDIIALPTMCSAELTDGVPTSVAGEPYVVLNFSLHEIQPAKTLLRYLAGDTISSETFTRSTTATYINSALQVATAAINTKRDDHYVGAGASRSTLLEGARTNNAIRSQEFDNAAWTKGNATISANATTGPDGTTTADGLVEDATAGVSHYVLRSGLTTTASTNQAVSVYAARDSRAWVRMVTADRAGTLRHSWINLVTGEVGTKDSGHTVRVTTLTGIWFRIEVVFSSGAGAGSVDWYIASAPSDGVQGYDGTSVSALHLWGAQHEQDVSFATSYIPTVASAVARGADAYTLPFTTLPQEMTWYIKFVEQGTVHTGTTSGLFGIGASTNAAFYVLNNGSGLYRVAHTRATTLTSDASGTPAIGVVTEIRAVLFGDGSVQIGQSIAGAAETVGTQSGANALATAWFNTLLTLNDRGGAPGFSAIQSFKVVAGARSLTEMRAL